MAPAGELLMPLATTSSSGGNPFPDLSFGAGTRSQRLTARVQVADFLQAGRRSRLRDLTKHLAVDAEIRLLQTASDLSDT